MFGLVLFLHLFQFIEDFLFLAERGLLLELRGKTLLGDESLPSLGLSDGSYLVDLVSFTGDRGGPLAYDMKGSGYFTLLDYDLVLLVELHVQMT